MVSRLRLVFFLGLISFLNVAFGQEAPWEDGLQKAIDLLTGKTATLTGILAVAVIGYMAMFGKMELGRAAMIIVGIVLVFGAPHVVSWFS